jgi:tetratricopeptide (TPR) repeat protein
MAYYNRGIVYEELGNKIEALADYQKALDIDPNNVKYQNAISDSQYRRVFMSGSNDNDRKYSEEELNIVINHITKCISETNDNVEQSYLHNDRGCAYLEKYDYENAMSDFNLAIQINHKYAKPYYNRGLIFEFFGDKEEALTNYKEALNLNPHHELAKTAIESI